MLLYDGFKDSPTIFLIRRVFVDLKSARPRFPNGNGFPGLSSWRKRPPAHAGRRFFRVSPPLKIEGGDGRFLFSTDHGKTLIDPVLRGNFVDSKKTEQKEGARR